MSELADRSLKGLPPKKAETLSLAQEEENLPSGVSLDPAALTPGSVIHLQRIIGNQAVQEMLKGSARESATADLAPHGAGLMPSGQTTIQRDGPEAGPTAPAPAPAAPAVDPMVAIRRAARSLVETGGTADNSDLDVVVAELIKIPLPALTALRTRGIRVVVCRNSVTEVRTDLRGVHPRGWREGATWDTVPGLNDPAHNRVIIATRNGRVPPRGDGHGGYNLVLHEVGHAIGHSFEGAGGLTDPNFIAARNADRARLDDYEGQAGRAGVQETYAESFARFYGHDPADARSYPHLHAYWATNPFIVEAH